eukprot:s1582_g12.t1
MATAPDGGAVPAAAGDGSPPAGGMAVMEMNVAMRMVAAAESAAEAARAATKLMDRSTADEGKTWWKLLPKPPTFDYASREQEIAAWREWSWMFEQYMASVDSKFSDDIQQMRSNLNRPIDPVDFSDAERQRNHFLYSLLSSLMRQRSLLVVKQIPASNGLEAYRILVQQNEPLSKNRSMGLLNVIMNWPAFSGKMSYMQHILKLEHAYSEYEKLGNKLNDDLKTAVLMRSVTGQLKVWLQLQVSENTTYAKVREMILMYDASTTRWSEQMVLGLDSNSGNADGPIPMEIDRVEGKGKGKGGGKGKSKDKGFQKGKSGGKQKGKDGKGKSKGDGKGSKGGGAADRAKGKGKGGDNRACFICGRSGHLAKDCWQNVRNVSADAQGSTVAGSPVSSVSGMTSVSQTQPGTQSGSQPSNLQATQHRVARICETCDDAKHDELVFDLRCPSPTSSLHGSVKVVHHFIGDSDDCMLNGFVRAVVDEMDDDGEELYNILVDSGADASIFPLHLLDRGVETGGTVGRLHDAQGSQIPVEAVKDMEIRLKDISGKTVVLREKVAISSCVSQPILSFGRLMENGWTLDGCSQAMTHSFGAHVPVELQNKSLTVQGTIRVLKELSGVPTFCRTTLIQKDDKKWYVVELCERLDGLIQLDAEFYELKGKRNVVTILTDGEKDPMVMGFKLIDVEPQQFPVVADDDDVEIEPALESVDVEGADVPEGQIVVRPSSDEEINVNGTVLKPSSALAALRAGCQFYNLSTSGSKQRCFQRLIDHQKKLELELVISASRDAQQQLQRQPKAPPAADLPSESEQAAHRLTHLPFAAWCPSCLAHRARQNRHERTGESHSHAVPTVSFDFFYTKADGDEEPDETTPDTVLSLVIVCSQTGYTACVPLQHKNQLDLMNRELVQFVQRLGHSECNLRCDNEPAILQLQRLATRTRQSMGLKTKMSSSVAYDHGNSLAENAVQRVRSLACSLMHQVHGRLGITLSTSNAMWSWALRHSAWLLSRFSVINGATPYELAHGRQFSGALCEYGEPVYGFIHPGSKAAAKWRRAIFLGKSEDQNSFVLFDGKAVVLTKNVRRITTTWRSHMAFYLHNKCHSWQYRSGFGSRILPTMKKTIPKAVSFEVPLGPIEGSKLHDADAEAVIKFAEDEKKAEEEQFAMSQHDVRLEDLDQQKIFDDGDDVEVGAAAGVASLPASPGGAASSSAAPMDPSLMVPTTPPRDDLEMHSPRIPATTRPSDGGEDEVQKRAKVEDAKKQRINRLKAEYEERLSAVKVAYKEYFTMDDYSTELDVEEPVEEEQDDWAGENEVELTGVPEALWFDFPHDSTPVHEPDSWIEELADQTEVKRLVAMGVLVPAAQFTKQISGKLTTKFVRDWRLKEYGKDESGNSIRRWMRRSRYVAREFARERRLDTFSPATGSHTANLLPLKYLWKKQLTKELNQGHEHEAVLGCLDIKDAFLQVDQEEPILVHIQGEPYVIQKNLPGQRMGARAWYDYLRKFLTETFGYGWCSEQPCLASNGTSTLLIHVDDILFVGNKSEWETFLKGMSLKFAVSHSELDGPGTSITFLRRTITEMDGWLMLTPGTSVSKVVSAFETAFGPARAQKIPCDGSIQLEDNSEKLKPNDASQFRSIIGLCLYVARERPDLMYTIKELACAMAAPTLTSLQRLRKLVGFMKTLGDVAVKLKTPVAAEGKTCCDGNYFWVLESYTDADWSSNKSHRRSTSCGMHYLNGAFVYGSSRSQKTVSLSSCESELHSIVSGMCDGIFILACAEYVFGEKVQHIQYTDSSSARQLVSRQGCGKVRHVSGKILWVQQRVAEKLVDMRQVETVWNLADIGTKSLSQHRLLLLMHETGLVYVATQEDVGTYEYQAQCEKTGNRKQLKQLAKTIMRMSLAMGLEPVGVMGQQCNESQMSSTNNLSWWTLFWIFLAIATVVAVVVLLWKLWKGIKRNIYFIEMQLADHYDYAAQLCQRLDTIDWLMNSGRTVQDQVNEIATDLARHIGDTQSALEVLDETTDCIRFGLMEFGGFVRRNALTASDRAHMFIQERANFTVWNMERNRPDTTDAVGHEEGEEEEPTEDEVERGPIAGMENLINAMRSDQNVALAREFWDDSAQIQSAIMSVLDASSGFDGADDNDADDDDDGDNGSDDVVHGGDDHDDDGEYGGDDGDDGGDGGQN